MTPLTDLEEGKQLVNVADFVLGDEIKQILFCKSKAEKDTKAGKPYYDLILQDKTGAINGKIWEINSLRITDFEAGNFLYVTGKIESYNDALQIKVFSVRIATEEEYVPEDFWPITKRNIDQMYAQICHFIELTKNPQMKALLESFFVNDPEFKEQFKRCSAAREIHHAYIGGLLEHTLTVATLCWNFCIVYKQLNRDLLIAAALLHDIGKVKEFSDFPMNDYTDDGMLLGHIVMGCEMVGDRIKTIPDFPEKTASELRHCILAHHGKLDFGSPVKPALMEATALHFADNLDAKMEVFIEQVVPATSDDWLGRNWMLDTNVRKTTPLEG